MPIHALVPVSPPPPEASAEVLVTFESAPQDSEFSMKTDDGSSLERIIGRIFAWTCTTLYLTSRLPQIWKNYVRKSVEVLPLYWYEQICLLTELVSTGSLCVPLHLRLPRQLLLCALYPHSSQHVAPTSRSIRISQGEHTVRRPSVFSTIVH